MPGFGRRFDLDGTSVLRERHGSKAIDTGIQQITPRTRGRVETNRSVSATIRPHFYPYYVGNASFRLPGYIGIACLLVQFEGRPPRACPRSTPGCRRTSRANSYKLLRPCLIPLVRASA